MQAQDLEKVQQYTQQKYAIFCAKIKLLLKIQTENGTKKRDWG